MVFSVPWAIVTGEPLFLAGRIVLDCDIVIIIASHINVTEVIDSNSYAFAGIVMGDPLFFAG